MEESTDDNKPLLKKLTEAHYFQLSSQGNVYTLTNLWTNNINKILAASLKREVYCFEYPDNSTDILTPTTKEVLFTYIPGVAEILSIDAFNKSETDSDFVIGIAITKAGGDQPRENYLNIYSAWESTADLNLESIAQNCLSVELNYIPYQLYHTLLPSWKENGDFQRENVWLLSGSDDKIHIYKEHVQNHTYKEMDVSECFPEFENPSSIVMWMDVQYYKDNTRRVSVFGCECGFVKMCIVDTKTLEILSSHELIFENTVSCVQIFKMEPVLISPLSLTQEESKEEEQNFNLIVINSNLPSVVFTDILDNGFQKSQELMGSDYFNVACCCCLADIDFDGENEILIGTYGQEILAYKLTEEGWVMKGTKSLSQPIFAIRYIDVTGDGVNELIVSTMKGVHIFQHDQMELLQIIEEKLKILKDY